MMLLQRGFWIGSLSLAVARGTITRPRHASSFAVPIRMTVKITFPPGKQQQRHEKQPPPAPKSRLLPSRRPFRVNPTTTRLDEIGTPTIQRPVSLQEMGQLLLHEKKTFGAALTGIGLASACQMCVPHIFGRVVDLLSASVGIGVSMGGASELVSNSVVMEGLRDNAMAMLGVGLAGTAATYVSTAQLDMVGQRISMDLRKRLFSNIVRKKGGREGRGGRNEADVATTGPLIRRRASLIFMSMRCVEFPSRDVLR